MIAEMSEKKDSDQKEASSPAAKAGKPEESKTTKNGNKLPSPHKKPMMSSPPKSSFAAWKLAKGRKNGAKSPTRKEISVGRKEQAPSNNDVVGVVPTETKVTPPSSASTTPTESIASPKKKDTSAVPALVDAGSVTKKSSVTPASLPPKKAMKNLAAKKNVSPKKALAASKREKEAQFPKKEALPIKKEGLPPKKLVVKKEKEAMAGKKEKSGKKSKKSEAANLNKASTFPEKIMELLQGGLAPKAIYWLPEGEAIAVDPDNFKDSTVISKQFRGNKLSSFVRSLNRW